MGMTNLQHSLRKKFSALTGELAEVRANIERIQREQSKLPELEARIPKLEALIESAAMLLNIGEGPSLRRGNIRHSGKAS